MSDFGSVLHMTVQDYKERYNYVFKPGSVVVFYDAGVTHLGLITEIYMNDNNRECKLREADEDGRLCIRSLDWDVEHGKMVPLLPKFADNLHTPVWDKWREKHLME